MSGRELSTGDTVLLVGTKRGLFQLSSPDRENWTCEAPLLPGHRIYASVLDQREGARLFAADNGDFFGSFVRYSDDFGRTWHEPERGIAFAEESGESLKNIWTIVPGRSTEPGVVYVGVDPASLWVSRDGGVTWEMNEGLAQSSHPLALGTRRRRTVSAYHYPRLRGPDAHVDWHLCRGMRAHR